MRMIHSSVAIGAPQKVLLLGCMWIVSGLDIDVRLISIYFSGHRAGASSNELCYFAKTKPVIVIFPYTTALFYGKKMIVHTVLLSVQWCVATSFYQSSASYVSFYTFFNLRNLLYLVL